jgi:hypothetical protein
MKPIHILSLIIATTLSACGPSQRITNIWINPDVTPNGPYESIFVIVLSQTKETSFNVEDRLANTIAMRGQNYVLSSTVFPPNLGISEEFSREQMVEAIQRTGCDAVFMLAVLDVKSVDTYHPGVAYRPGYYNVYHSYYGYYNHYYPMVYSPGYYTSDKTYYIETNFYDVEKDVHLWLIQSEAYNPSSIDSWFDTYMNQLLNELIKEGLIE